MFFEEASRHGFFKNIFEEAGFFKDYFRKAFENVCSFIFIFSTEKNRCDICNQLKKTVNYFGREYIARMTLNFSKFKRYS